MKYLLILTILYFVGVQGQVPQEQIDQFIRECAEELNMPSIKNPKIFVLQQTMARFNLGLKTDKSACAEACLLRKFLNIQGLTIHAVFQNDIHFASQYDLISPKISVEELTTKLENCYAKEKDECEFFKCVDMYNPPFSYLEPHSQKYVVKRIIGYYARNYYSKHH